MGKWFRAVKAAVAFGRGAVEPLESRTMMSAGGVAGAAVPWAEAPAGVVAITVDFSPAAAPTAGDQVRPRALSIARSQLGGNLNGQSDRVQDHAFTDLVKTTRGFYNLAGRVASNGKQALARVDANGWPTEDFAVAVADNSEYGVPVDAGTYRMSFTGPAAATVAVRRTGPASAGTVPSTAPVPTLKKVGYNAATGVHTYDVVVPAGVRTIAFDFRKTGGVVRNLKVLQPGYSLSGYPTFTNEYLNLLRNLGPNVLRFMDWTHTNDNLTANWSDRPRTTEASNAWVHNAGDLQPAEGVAWEYVIELANTLNTGVWVNVPIRATDDYVRNLANLLRTKLKSTLPIYVEYSNEVWNGQFEQFNYNWSQAKAEVAANPKSNLKYDGSTDSIKWADRRYARRLKQIGDIFRSVWTAAGQGNPINTRVRPVLASQVANPSRFDNMLKYVAAVYGPPKNYFHSLGVAPYINLGASASKAGLTKDQVLAALSASANNYANGSALSNMKAKASAYGLKLQAYEAGIDTFGPTSIAAKRAAALDPRINEIMQRYLKAWYAKGGGQLNWFTLGARSFNSPYGTWSITENLRDLNQPKEQAFRAIRDAGLGQGQ